MPDDQAMRLLCPTGHLGTAPLQVDSLRRGVAQKPDAIIADSGSADIGPAPLALDISSSPMSWQRSDLTEMLLAARDLNVPMIIGSAGDTGANSRVDLFVELIKQIAAEHRLPRFTLGYFYSEVEVERLTGAVRSGVVAAGLGGRPPLTEEDLHATQRVVAVAGVHPYLKLLDAGADVIIGGRSGDATLFAAPAIRAGYPANLAYHLGKLLECASFCAEPYAGKESVLGTIGADRISVTAMHPDQRCTVASVAGHAMYERANPFFEYVLGGRLDMTNCQYAETGPQTCTVTGAVFEPSSTWTVKLEGAGRVGERSIGFAGIRDPYTVANLDKVIDWARAQVRARYGESGYEVHYHVYGRDGVLGQRESKHDAGHEVGVLVEAVAPSADMAEEVCMSATKQMFYARLPAVKGTAGGVSYLFDEALAARPACRWTVHHTLAVDDPLELFPTHLTQAGI